MSNASVQYLAAGETGLPTGAATLIAAKTLTFTGTPGSGSRTAQTIEWVNSGTADLDSCAKGRA